MPKTVVATDFTLAAGQAITATNEAALHVQTFSGPSPRITINGLLESRSPSTSFNTAEALRYDTLGGSTGVVEIGTTGIVRAISDSPTFAFAHGVSAISAIDLTNNGRIEVTTGDYSIGISNTYSQSRFVNHGVIQVQGGSATGIATSNGATILNTGEIDVTGKASAIGVSVGFIGLSRPFENSGTIRVRTTAPSDLAIGVSLSGNGRFTNSGLVEGPLAIRLATDLQTTQIVNTGRLVGHVDMRLAVGDLTNSGAITGEVRMGGGDDRYDGRLGTVTGSVSGGAGSDSLAGGAGAETLSGGDDNDTVGGSSGADRLDGGAGTDILTFAGFNQGVRLDVAAQTISTGGSFSGFERYVGSDRDDTILGSGGAETVSSGLGADTVNGGGGNDSLTDTGGSNYIRGDEGDDQLAGGAQFDDLNGNMGNDTAAGGLGDDWVVGGKDNDRLAGDAGADLVYGNLGADTCDGGDGADIVRGGQDNDVCLGGAGDDFVAGDKGSDTLTGGAGADVFHTFGEAGVDRVTDFNLAQGDRVHVDPGTQYALRQVAADTVIDMVGGGQMVLVGVQMTSLTPGWIFGA